MAGFEPATSSLPRKCSTPELHGRNWSGRRGSNSRPLAWKANALPTELLPHLFIVLRWVEMDSNHRRRKPADLQSAPFGHSGIHPSSGIFRANYLFWHSYLRNSDCKIIEFSSHIKIFSKKYSFFCVFFSEKFFFLSFFTPLLLILQGYVAYLHPSPYLWQYNNLRAEEGYL